MDLLAAAPIVMAASSQASNWLFDEASAGAGPTRAGGPAIVVGSPGMVPVFISDWYIAAFSGEASMTDSS